MEDQRLSYQDQQGGGGGGGGGGYYKRLSIKLSAGRKDN